MTSISKREKIVTSSSSKCINAEGSVYFGKRVDELRELINDKSINLDPNKFNEYLEAFLRPKKFNVDKAFKTYKKFCALYKDNPQVEQYCRASDYQEFLRDKFISVMIRRDARGRFIFFIQYKNWNTKKYNADEALAIHIMILIGLLDNVEAQENGLVFLLNCQDLGIQHAKLMSLSRIRAIVQLFQGSFPISIKEVHVFNNHAIANLVYSVLKPLMSEKMRNRIFFHGHDLTKLQDWVGLTALPEYLGGDISNDAYSDDSVIDKILRRENYIREAIDTICARATHR